MRYYYAQLDNRDIVISVSALSGQVNRHDMIKLHEYDTDILGYFYNRVSKEFVEVED